MPSFVLRDPATPPPTEAEEDPFARHARLLCEGKLMKELKKAKIPEPDRYQMFACIVGEVTDIENELNTDKPLYIAKWKKSYNTKHPVWQVISLLIPMPVGAIIGALSPGGTVTYEYVSSHRLPAHAGERFWLRRALTLLGGVVTGAIAGLAGAMWMIFLIVAVVDGMLPGINGWIISALGLVAIGAGYAFHKIQRLSVPRFLHMYAGRTFQLVSLKRVKTPRP
ncbi:MAG: hypothetical protein Q7Q73_15200 [Verrucomicrobiota bacterium JB024]|nr:hypothetical protein [Verrucomicrobiota bacterium JB024]